MKESSFPQRPEATNEPRHRSLRYLPAVVSIAWQIMTLAVFMSGIWTYPLASPWPVFWFICGTQACFLLGYALAVRGSRRNQRRSSTQRAPSRLAVASAVVTLMLFLPTSLLRTGRMLPDVLGGIRNPGLAYAASLLSRGSQTPLIEYLRMPFGFLTAALEPIIVFYWPRLPKSIRLLGVLAVSSTAALYLAGGTNKGVFDTILLAASFSLASACAGVLVIGRRKRVVVAILLALSVVAFLGFFSGVSLRAGSGLSYGVTGSGSTIVYADMTKPVLSHIPVKLRTVILAVTSYVSQGYYGLGLALQKPFVPMYGMGSSMFLTRQAVRLVGNPSIEQRSYPVRVENTDGWSAYSCWSTMYVWIASDVGFPGVLLVMVVVGWLLGRAWLGVLWNHDVFSVCLLGQMVTMLTYASANNQCVQTGESWFAFVSTVLLWFAANSMRLRHELDHRRLELADPVVDTDKNTGTRIALEGR